MTEFTHRGVRVEVSDELAEMKQPIDVVAEIKNALNETLNEEIALIQGAEVYSKPNCPYCVKAKYLLTQRNIPFEEYDAVELRDKLVERVRNETGQPPRTVPQIWLDGKYIGGYDQLAAYFTEQDRR